MIPIEVTLVGTVTDFNDVQKAKAPPSIIDAGLIVITMIMIIIMVPIDVTLVGIVTDNRFEQYLKESVPNRIG